MQSADKLVAMANQIARNVAVRGDKVAVQVMAEHIQKFWEPRMRSQILKHLEAGGEGLDPMAKSALALLKAPASG